MLNKTIEVYNRLAAEETEELRYYYRVNKDNMKFRDWQTLKEIHESKKVFEEIVTEELEKNGYGRTARSR